MVLPTNSHCIPVQHSPTGFCNGADSVLCEIRTACFCKKEKGGKVFPVHRSIAALIVNIGTGGGGGVFNGPSRPLYLLERNPVHIE